MEYFLLTLILVLVIIIGFLFFQNSKIKEEHTTRMFKLQEIVRLLNRQQELLNDKVLISNNYNSSYTNEIKIIGNEIVSLQKIFLNILNYKNIN